jgi:hypothetical protein
MSRVAVLVERLQVQAQEEEEKYNQTAVLPLSTYYRLCGLAEYLHIPRNRLSGLLLTAAIEEAISALPTEKQDFAIGGIDHFGTPAEQVAALGAYEKHIQEGAERDFPLKRDKGPAKAP